MFIVKKGLPVSTTVSMVISFSFEKWYVIGRVRRPDLGSFFKGRVKVGGVFEGRGERIVEVETRRLIAVARDTTDEIEIGLSDPQWTQIVASSII